MLSSQRPVRSKSPASQALAAPLAGREAFRVFSVSALCETIESRLGVECVGESAERPIDAWANFYRLPSSELWFFSYGDPLKLTFGESDYVRIQIPYAGVGITRCDGQVTRVSRGQACISSADTRFSFGRGFQQLVWRVKRDVLARKLATMTGRPVTEMLRFNPLLKLTSAPAIGLLSVLDCVLRTIAGTPVEVDAFLMAELEQALMVSLLVAGEHNFIHLLRGAVSKGASWQVRRIEDYIVAHLDKPFSMKDATALTGSSARTIHRAFRQSRDYSPVQFSKQRRLQKAWQLLHEPVRDINVTDVAIACGFNDMSHFSRDFASAFGVAPSVVLKSRKT